MKWNVRIFYSCPISILDFKDFRKNAQELKTLGVGDSLYRLAIAIILIFNEIVNKFLYWQYAIMTLNAYVRKHSCKNN